MLKQLSAMVMGMTVMGCAAASAPANVTVHEDQANILVMGEDFDRDTVPRNSRVFRQVIQELENQFALNGYTSFDERVVGRGYFVEGRTRRPRSELIEAARSVDQPIDAIVVFSIYSGTQKLPYMTKARMRIEGELIAPHSGRSLGQFEVVSRNDYSLPVNCSRECVLENLSDEARLLGRDLGDVLVEQLDHNWGPKVASRTINDGDAGFERLYDLCFDGFTQNEVLDLEDYLVVFSGYQSHRPRIVQATRQCFAYESTITNAKLNRNLVKMLDHTGFNGRVRGDGTAFTMVKVPERKSSPIDPAGW